VWIWWLVPFVRQCPIPQCDNRQAVFGPTKSDCARPPSVFARFSACWLLFVSKSEIPLEGASLWLDFGHLESCDKYIKHHCKGRLLQRHPEAVWPHKYVCTVRRDVYRKLNNESVFSFTKILFIMPVLKLSRRTVYIDYCKAFDSVPHSWLIRVLEIYKINPVITNSLQQLMKKWTTTLQVKVKNNRIMSDLIHIWWGI